MYCDGYLGNQNINEDLARGIMLTEFIKQHHLPNSFEDTAKNYFIPLAKEIAQQAVHRKTWFLGVNGCQGSGKSTLTDFLSQYLLSEYQLTVVNLSLDDFYLSKAARQNLAKHTHPLLATRGVPGTHDTALLSNTLKLLKTNHSNTPIALSKFDKATDDLVPQNAWQIAPKKIDIVLFEGWCWGVPEQTSKQLKDPVNTLEENEDDGKWRNYVNDELASKYSPLYQYMDAWLMLKAPNFNCVANWRWQQEEKLAKYNHSNDTSGVMTKAQVERFIQHYQRLTEHGLLTLPQKCRWLLCLDENRHINQMIKKEKIMTEQALIFTDLDGTLLDHFDYSFTDALDVIQKLKANNIPIIPNTSKTYAEMVNIRAEIALDSPFIVENGAAVFIPVNFFDEQPQGTLLQGKYWVKEFCPERAHWLSLLKEGTEEYADLFQGFSNLSLEELCNLTGLKPESAKYALERNYTEPLLWHGDSKKKSEFIAHMESLGAHLLQGGRFLSVGGHSDKGNAMLWLANEYKKQKGTAVKTIALGDSHNDTEMLQAADIAIQIKSPIHPFTTLTKKENCYKTKEFGPKGWAQTIDEVLFPQTSSITE